ncbi:vitamin D3 receptor B-like isoform X3 [Littorina saxatilis]|uniref:Nuclear hormone receptor HR96 n=1 Tax=Littorina saxatilis TaxID=31220 RepID=A0AAN9BPN3_9CAEN
MSPPKCPHCKPGEQCKASCKKPAVKEVVEALTVKGEKPQPPSSPPAPSPPAPPPPPPPETRVVGDLGGTEDQGSGKDQATMDDPMHTKLEAEGQRLAIAPGDSPPTTPPGKEDTGTGPGPLRKKRSLEDKICRICGDKALAHNFDVITCESCKAFFRRNAVKREELRDCAFQRSCPINIRTRRFCSACRLKKCFAIGMRADMILDEKKRRARMEKMTIKRAQQRPRPASCDSNGESPPSSDEGSISNGYGPHTHQNGDSDHSPKSPSENTEPLKACPKRYYLPRAKGFEPVPAGQLPSDPHMYWRLTEDERALLTQITATYQNTILRLPQQGGASERTERAVNSITLEDLLGRCDVCANNVVKLMKGLSDYRTLQVEDQLAALKACAMRTLILKGAACFVVERDAWIKAYGELPVSLFVRVTGHEKLILQHAAFCKSLKTLLKNDVTMYALLQCVVLFDPRQPNIADRQLVNTLRDKYLQLLKHYLESQVSYEHAEDYMEHLKDKLAELTVLGQKMTNMFKEWTGLIQPLMIEVLSLA